MKLHRAWPMALLLPCLAAAAPSADPARAAFLRYDHGWRTFDTAEIMSAMAPNFEWVNSVGLRFTSQAELTRFLNRLFANPRFRAGSSGPLIIKSIRQLSPEIVLISSSEVTDGQKTWDTGKTVPHQHTNELTVMQLIHGNWLIVSDLTSDEANGI